MTGFEAILVVAFLAFCFHIVTMMFQDGDL